MTTPFSFSLQEKSQSLKRNQQKLPQIKREEDDGEPIPKNSSAWGCNASRRALGAYMKAHPGLKKGPKKPKPTKLMTLTKPKREEEITGFAMHTVAGMKPEDEYLRDAADSLLLLSQGNPHVACKASNKSLKAEKKEKKKARESKPEIKKEDEGAVSATRRREKYFCTCNESFSTVKALRAHFSAHKVRILVHNSPKKEYEAPNCGSSKKLPNGNPHVCNVCGKSFSTGRALGGHKSHHRKPGRTAS